MNKQTHVNILAESVEASVSATVQAGMGDTMPVVGGAIVECDFMADGDILFGYFSNYLMTERAGTKLAVSTEVKFVDDQTVFKGTARYDGTPVIAESFALININNVAPTTTIVFPS